MKASEITRKRRNKRESLHVEAEEEERYSRNNKCMYMEEEKDDEEKEKEEETGRVDERTDSWKME